MKIWKKKFSLRYLLEILELSLSICS